MTTKLEDLAERYVRLGEQRAELETQAKRLKAEQSDIERMFMRAAEDNGMDKFTAGPLSISVKDEITFRHRPENWNEVMELCFEHGRYDAVQKRPNSKVLQELVEEGVLPMGLLTVDTFKKVSVRKA